MSALNVAPNTYEANEEQTNAKPPLNTQHSNEIFANSLLHSYESIIRFRINKEEVGKKDSKCEQSSDFKLNGVTWKLEVCKKNVDTVDYASVGLVSTFDGDTASWSCEAEANVKLLPLKDGDKIIEGKIKSFTYSKATPSKPNEKFIEWKDLNDKYLKDGEAFFEFHVKTKSPDRSPRLEQTTAKFNVRVKQINQLGNEYSNEVVVRGIRWQIMASKMTEHFAVFVIANENDIDTDAKWEVTAEIKLLSNNKEKFKKKKFSKALFDWTQTSWGYVNFLKWDEFIKVENKYVQNNAALLEIELIVNPKPSS